MAFCKECGKQIEDSAPICPYCGTDQGISPAAPVQDQAQNFEQYEKTVYVGFAPRPDSVTNAPGAVQQPVQTPAQQSVQTPVQQPVQTPESQTSSQQTFAPQNGYEQPQSFVPPAPQTPGYAAGQNGYDQFGQQYAGYKPPMDPRKKKKTVILISSIIAAVLVITAVVLIIVLTSGGGYEGTWEGSKTLNGFNVSYRLVIDENDKGTFVISVAGQTENHTVTIEDDRIIFNGGDSATLDLDGDKLTINDTGSSNGILPVTLNRVSSGSSGGGSSSNGYAGTWTGSKNMGGMLCNFRLVVDSDNTGMLYMDLSGTELSEQHSVTISGNNITFDGDSTTTLSLNGNTLVINSSGEDDYVFPVTLTRN